MVGQREREQHMAETEHEDQHGVEQMCHAPSEWAEIVVFSQSVLGCRAVPKRHAQCYRALDFNFANVCLVVCKVLHGDYGSCCWCCGGDGGDDIR